MKIQYLEQIEKYVNGSLTKEEQIAFEQELQNNAELRQHLKEYKALTNAISRLIWKVNIQIVKGRLIFEKWLLRASITTIIFGAPAMGFEYFNAVEEKEIETTKPEIIEELINPEDTVSEVNWSRVGGQVFKFAAKKPQLLESKNFVLYGIPSNAFTHADGKAVSGEIEIVLSEAFTPMAIMKAGLSTYSNGELLETGGMFTIEAFQNGVPLKLAKGKQIAVDVPIDAYKDGMQLFDGEVTEDGAVNWINPKPIKKYLTEVDITTLDFYPPGFRREVMKLGFNNPSKKTLDSLFYSVVCQQVEVEEPIEEADFEEEEE